MTKAFDIYVKPEDFAATLQTGWLSVGVDSNFEWVTAYGMYRVRLDGVEPLFIGEPQPPSQELLDSLERLSASHGRPWVYQAGWQGPVASMIEPTEKASEDAETPRWPHEFAYGVESVFLGRFESPLGNFDLYAYRLNERAAWQVASKNGSSSLAIQWQCLKRVGITSPDSLIEAKRRAIARGLIEGGGEGGGA